MIGKWKGYKRNRKFYLWTLSLILYKDKRAEIKANFRAFFKAAILMGYFVTRMMTFC